MRIFVCSKDEMMKKEEQTPEFFDDDKFFITIKSSMETDYAFEYNERNVLRLTFDDVCDLSLVSEDDKDSVIVFNKKLAKKIFNFVNELNPKKILYVNCSSGVSRSGGIGIVINEYLNKFLINNTADYEFFNYTNSHIQPNTLVKELLEKEFFGNYNF